MPKPNIMDAEADAKQAYDIYRGMKNPMTDPHWDDLTRPQRGLIEWAVRWTMLKYGIDGQSGEKT